MKHQYQELPMMIAKNELERRKCYMSERTRKDNYLHFLVGDKKTQQEKV